ncbi:ComF family protein [Cerasicoccus arenae]|uniref:Amidophosphoribosyltransferase n=1 Tax=Cerasicoccus arenae TaxID=424488 RepID=A0A8J3DFF1_9BACT|nr:ComF family protein [Cerasicoccus arenae]MBK1859494.1 ComF family protein [Cerasicoccus arenae]GHB94967.1 amidophosphoribosyltransferase [Cerasicoccus arenae]
MATFSRQLHAWSQNLLDLIYPRECLITNEPVEKESPCRFLSRKAIDRIYFIDDPHCATCGAPFFGELIALRDCPHCRELNPSFDRGRSLFLLRETGRELIHELKYRKGRHLLPDILSLIRKRPNYLNFLANGILVPIPLHSLRERERGYNQSLLIARQMAEASGCALAPALRRVKHTETQTRLDRAQRQANMRAAFALDPKTKIDPTARYILVDDVFTTGSTLNSAAQELCRAGAKQIDVATLGHG